MECCCKYILCEQCKPLPNSLNTHTHTHRASQIVTSVAGVVSVCVDMYSISVCMLCSLSVSVSLSHSLVLRSLMGTKLFQGYLALKVMEDSRIG